MASFFGAPSLMQLTKEVNQLMAPPTWPTTSVGDGMVGDTSHQARVSSHNPLWSAPGKWSGIIRAVDIGISGRDANRILKELIGDPRVWYVIHKGHIWSRTYGWVKSRYTGNPHSHHIHVSLRESSDAWADTRPWFGNQKPARVKPGPVNFDRVRDQFLIAAGVKKGQKKCLYGVKRLQYGLYHHVDKSIVVDGWVGEATLNAWGKWEAKHGGTGRPRVPDMKSLKEFDKKVWAVTSVQKPKKR